MFQNTIGCILIFTVAVLLALPMGKYLSKVYKGEKSLLDFLKPMEISIFKICGINPLQEMNWKQYLIAMAVINSVWLIFSFIILLFQGSLFLNPAGNPSMEWTLALNSAISFLTSTNLQHYSGESGATYLSQVFVFMFLQFVSAATSLSIGVAIVRGLSPDPSPKGSGVEGSLSPSGRGLERGLGNFYQDFLHSLTRILFPLCIIVGIFFIFNGVPMTFEGPQTITTLEGTEQVISQGPVASFLPIKELGSNGGGFYGANDAHPLENPNFFTFILHSLIVFLLPMAFIFFIGYYLNERKFAYIIFGVMTLGLLLVTIPIIVQEVGGNPNIAAMGISQADGAMEGKEVRFGAFYSAFYCGENVAIPAGTLVGMHDSFMPLSGAFMLLAMNFDGFFGGLGTGWINLFLYLIVTLFVGSLMIGRTPELFGKKIGILEMQITVGVIILQNLVPLALTAIASFTYTHYTGSNDSLAWLSNTGPHGFTTMLYEYISSTAGNGSGFESLGDNTIFWNLTTAFTMFMGRFVPIVGAVWIAGLLLEKTYTPPSSGTLKTDSVTFGTFLFAIIIIVNVLSLFVVLMLGPVAEYFLLK